MASSHLAPERRGSLSDILNRIANDDSRERISLRDLLGATQERAVPALMFIFAIPNIIPLPPGASSILGAPLLFLTAQLALGKRPWLPRVIADRSMERHHFATTVRRVTPWLVRGERLLRPRLRWLAQPPMEYLVGTICLILSVILFLPIPLGNIPPALAICMFSLAIMEHDGMWTLAGLATSVIAVVLVSGVLFALFESALFVVGRI
jgi:hypothetical protein